MPGASRTSGCDATDPQRSSAGLKSRSAAVAFVSKTGSFFRLEVVELSLWRTRVHELVVGRTVDDQESGEPALES
jgi:hypothetical protein